MIAGEDIRSLASNVSDRLRALGIRCAFAESLTGGMIASSMVDIPGASDVFEGAIVSYTNEMKMNVLKVPGDIIEKYTEVSVQCAQAMAEGVHHLTSADICVAVTGYAGGNKKDPKDGYVCIGYFFDKKKGAFDRQFEGDRREVRLQTTKAALELILELIDNHG